MLRKQQVYLKLKELTDEQVEHERKMAVGFSAGDIAELLSMDRANVSRDLNMLAKEGKVIKINGRPVKFICEFEGAESLMMPERASKAEHELALHNIIGAEDSLKSAVQQAKAAVLYPGKRHLHILLTGATGVGKTTFAELIYKYAKEEGCIRSNGQFVVFNCSEYAENPQLLLSHLFGYVKGAFTGADSEKEGLIEKADGGVLLLDEIHRLTPEGQEMLFMFIDKGTYRKMGESDALRKADVMFIGATTENPDSVLLKTFTRRFPMIIKVPALDDRPKHEKLEFIKMFFNMESESLGLPVIVDEQIINMLLDYPCAANIGQLQADIQLICARAFLDHVTEGEGVCTGINIQKSMLPQHITEYYEHKENNIVSAAVESSVAEPGSYITEHYNRNISQDKLILATCITGEGAAVKIAENIAEVITDLDSLGIQIVRLDLEKSRIKGVSEEYAEKAIAVVGTVPLDIPGIPFISLEDWVLNNGVETLRTIVADQCRAHFADSEYRKIIKILKSSTVFIDAEKVYRQAVRSFELFDLKMNDRQKKSLEVRFLLHVACMLERVIQKLPIEYPNLLEVEKKYSHEFKSIKEAMANIESNFCVEIPDNEIGFIVDLIYTQ